MLNNLSYWEKKNFFTADIIIIGSGIVGLNAAIELKNTQPLLNIIVLERGFLPTGASTKNAGFACFGSISELIAQEKVTGADGLYQLISKRWNGLLKLRHLLGDKNIAYQHHGGFELFKPEQTALAETCVSKLRHFNNMIEDIVHQKEVYCTADQKISRFGFNQVDVLIENKLEAQIDPGLMMKNLLLKAQSIGIQVLNNCEVRALHQQSKAISIQTNQGQFNCKKVLVTTNAFVNELLPDLDLIPGRGQVIVTKPIPDLKLKGTFHYDEGYYYFRNIDDRILLGGGRNLDFATEQTTAFGETTVVQNALKNLLSTVILPGTEVEVEFKWSGIMAFGPKLEPIIKEALPNIFCAVRCNGMGIAIGSYTGQEAAELVLKGL